MRDEKVILVNSVFYHLSVIVCRSKARSVPGEKMVVKD